VTQIKVKNYTNWLNGQPISEASRDNCGLIGKLLELVSF